MRRRRETLWFIVENVILITIASGIMTPCERIWIWLWHAGAKGSSEGTVSCFAHNIHLAALWLLPRCVFLKERH